jgi:hypothetical protein
MIHQEGRHNTLAVSIVLWAAMTFPPYRRKKQTVWKREGEADIRLSGRP